MTKVIILYILCLVVFLIGIVIGLYLKNITRYIKRKRHIKTQEKFNNKFYGEE